MKRGVLFIGLDYLKHPLHGACHVCHRPARMAVIDRAYDRPIGQCCLTVSVDAAAALHKAGLEMPDASLITRNP